MLQCFALISSNRLAKLSNATATVVCRMRDMQENEAQLQLPWTVSKSHYFSVPNQQIICQTGSSLYAQDKSQSCCGVLVMQYCQGGTLWAALQKGHLHQSAPHVGQRHTSAAAITESVCKHHHEQKHGSAASTHSCQLHSSGQQHLVLLCESQCSDSAVGLCQTASELCQTALVEHQQMGSLQIPDPANPLQPCCATRSATTAPVQSCCCKGHLVPRLDRVLQIAQQVATAVQHVHQHGFVHGDVTSHNVLLVERPEAPGFCAVKLSDFGESSTFGFLQGKMCC